MRWRGSDGGRGRGTYGGGLMPGAASVPVSSGEGVAAIVVTHESAATIDDCLARLRAARGVSQVRVVDNGSRDDTLAIVQRHAATDPRVHFIANPDRSEEHTSELQSLMRISYAVFCLKKKTKEQQVTLPLKHN